MYIYVLMSHKINVRIINKTAKVYPCKPHFSQYRSGFSGMLTVWTCSRYAISVGFYTPVEDGTYYVKPCGGRAAEDSSRLSGL